jgi:hypothetical protein
MEQQTRAAAPRHAADAWERGGWAWDAAVYLLVGLGTLLGLVDGPSPGRRALMLGLAALFAGWYAWSVRRGLYDYDASPARVLPLVAVVVALWAALTWIEPTYYVMLFALYPVVYRSLPLRLAIPASLVLTALVVGIDIGQSKRPLGQNWPALINGALSAGFGVLFSIWITRIIQQSAERKQLIEQLEATRSELAAAEREAGRLGERQRLAREIHDTLTQGSSASCCCWRPPRGAGGDHHRDRDAAAAARRRRGHPGAGDPGGPGQRAQARAGLKGRPHAVVHGRRGGAGRARRRRRRGGGPDGNGRAAAGGGFGLLAMRERVAALGGSLTVESTAGGGTTVAATLPIADGCGWLGWRSPTTTRWSATACAACSPASRTSRWSARPPAAPRRSSWSSASGRTSC